MIPGVNRERYIIHPHNFAIPFGQVFCLDNWCIIHIFIGVGCQYGLPHSESF